MSIFDTHCHLNMIREPESGYYTARSSTDEEINNFVVNAKKNEITHIMNAGTFISEIDREIEICKKFTDNDIKIFCALANHPENIRTTGVIKTDEILKIIKNIDNSTTYIKAIGETGLDSHRTENLDFFDKQIKSFENHIEAGIILNLPIIIHAYGKEALDKSIDIAIQTSKNNNNFKYIFHCYDGDYENAKKIVDNNGIISISGILTFKKNEHTREVVKKIPLTFLTLETDAPFLAPSPVRGKPNETSYIKYTAEFFSKLLEIDYSKLCNKTTETGLSLFGLNNN